MKRQPKILRMYPDLVDRSYTMNPDLEYLSNNGAIDLEEGMVVMVAPVLRRFSILDMSVNDKTKIQLALAANRWCTVENLEVMHGRVKFVGVYKDGMTTKRIYPASVAWLIKKYPDEWRASPVPEASKPVMTKEQKRSAVIDLVIGAMSEQSLIDSGERTSMTPEQLKTFAAMGAADEIMRLFE